jgi:hypothetical protein
VFCLSKQPISITVYAIFSRIKQWWNM